MYNLTSDGENTDIFIAKYAQNGDLVNAANLGGAGSDETHLITAANKNTYITVNLDLTADFTPSSAVNRLTTSNASTCFKGNVFVAGVFNETANFWAITLTSNGSKDIFIAKFNSSGEVLFANKIGGSGSDNNISIAVDGDIYAAGNFNYTTDFNPDETGVYELTSGNEGNLFIAKYTNNGTFVYAKPIRHLMITCPQSQLITLKMYTLPVLSTVPHSTLQALRAITCLPNLSGVRQRLWRINSS